MQQNLPFQVENRRTNVTYSVIENLRDNIYKGHSEQSPQVTLTIMQFDMISDHFIRFIEEMKTKINDENFENIITFYDEFKFNSKFYVVTEYLEDGIPLSEKMKDLTTEEDKVKLIKDIAKGINAIHSISYIHRQITPESVIYVNRKYKLTNLVSVIDQVLIELPNPIGPKEYYAPELADYPIKYCKTIDIFSLACLSYEIFFKAQLFSKSDTLQERNYLPIRCTENMQKLPGEICDFIKKNIKCPYQERTLKSLLPIPTPNKSQEVKPIDTDKQTLNDEKLQIADQSNHSNYQPTKSSENAAALLSNTGFQPPPPNRPQPSQSFQQTPPGLQQNIQLNQPNQTNFQPPQIINQQFQPQNSQPKQGLQLKQSCPPRPNIQFTTQNTNPQMMQSAPPRQQPIFQNSQPQVPISQENNQQKQFIKTQVSPQVNQQVKQVQQFTPTQTSPQCNTFNPISPQPNQFQQQQQPKEGVQQNVGKITFNTMQSTSKKCFTQGDEVKQPQFQFHPQQNFDNQSKQPFIKFINAQQQGINQIVEQSQKFEQSQIIEEETPQSPVGSNQDKIETQFQPEEVKIQEANPQLQKISEQSLEDTQKSIPEKILTKDEILINKQVKPEKIALIFEEITKQKQNAIQTIAILISKNVKALEEQKIISPQMQ